MANLYAAQSNSTSSPLFTINPATAVTTQIGTTMGESCLGLVYDYLDGVLYGATSGTSTHPRSLITINTTTGVATLIGAGATLGGGTIPAGMAMDASGQIYLIDSNQERLLRVNKSTGAVTVVGTTAAPLIDAINGAAFTGDDQFLFLPLKDTGGQYLIDKTAGLQTMSLSQTHLSGGVGGDVSALTVDSSGIAWGLNRTGSPTLEHYDPTVGAITSVGVISPANANLRAMTWDVAPGSTGTVNPSALIVFDGQQAFRVA